MFFGLRDYQLEGAHFIGQNPKCGLIWDCGLGKTLTTLSAINHYSESTLPVLIVAPVRVARNVWPNEIDDWRFPLSYSVAAGVSAATRKKRLVADADITLINPESLNGSIEPRWRTVVVDESTYFKNVEAKRWSYLAKITARAERVVLLTGTPISGRGHLDLWGQFGLLGDANPLGTWWEFTQRYFSFDMFDRPRLHSGAEDTLNALIAPLVHRAGKDRIVMPEFIEVRETVEMDSKTKFAYDNLGLEENSYAPMRTLASGFLYEKHWSDEVNPIWHHDQKLRALRDIVDSCAGENLLVFTNFVASAERIASEFDAVRLTGSEKSASRAIRDWNDRKIPMLVLNPRSGGHGLNLQFGGNRIVWFDLPDSGELWTQANARLWRSGQGANTVVCHKIICAGTIDETIDGLLRKKCLNEENLLAAVAAG